MGAVHCVGCLVSHMRALHSVRSISCSFSSNHLTPVLHPNDVYIVLIGAVWVDGCERLSTTVGRRGPSVVSSTLCLHVSRWDSRSGVSVSVLHTLTLRNVGRVRCLLGVFILDTRRRKHVLRRAARAMTAKLTFSLVGP